MRNQKADPEAVSRIGNGLKWLEIASDLKHFAWPLALLEVDG